MKMPQIRKDVDFSNKNMMHTHSEYIKITKAILSNSKIVSAKMALKDQDAFDFVLYHIMMAEIDFNGRGTIYGYRKKRADWALLTVKNLLRKKSESLEINVEIPEKIESPTKNPSAIIEKKETLEKIWITAKRILPENNYNFLYKRYVDDMTYSSIGKIYGMSKQGVEQSIKSSLGLIKNELCVGK